MINEEAERAAFEAWARSMKNLPPLTRNAAEGKRLGWYDNSKVQSCWLAWQARAALDRGWLTSTSSNETARANAKAIALHIAALQAHIQELEGENASLRGEDPPFDLVALCSSCYGTGIGIGDQPCMACRGVADAKAAFDKHADELPQASGGDEHGN